VLTKGGWPVRIELVTFILTFAATAVIKAAETRTSAAL